MFALFYLFQCAYQKLKQNHSAVSTNHNIQLEAFSGIIALIWENDEVCFLLSVK